MRKLYPLLFVCCLMSFSTLKGQNTMMAEYDLVNLLCQEWQLSHGEVDGLRVQMPEKQI